MRIGVVSDPHGCLIGLKAALDWLEGAAVDTVVCAGDVATFGPQPNECITLLAEREIATAQGNCDRDVVVPSPAGHDTADRAAQLGAINDWCRERLTEASRQWLAGLPPRLAPAPGVVIVHGGLKGPDEIVDAGATPSFPQGVAIVAAGHLHVPLILRAGQGIWVNAGSAGRSCDGNPRAALAVLEQDSRGWTASIHRVPFDFNAAAAAIRRAQMPFAERLVEIGEKACWW